MFFAIFLQHLYNANLLRLKDRVHRYISIMCSKTIIAIITIIKIITNKSINKK